MKTKMTFAFYFILSLVTPILAALHTLIMCFAVVAISRTGNRDLEEPVCDSGVGSF